MKLTEEQIKNRELNLDVIIPQYKQKVKQTFKVCLTPH